MPKPILSVKRKTIPNETDFQEVPGEVREAKPVPTEARTYKEVPDEDLFPEDVPEETKAIHEVPANTQELENTPTESEQLNTTPDKSEEVEELPEESQLKDEVPSEFDDENVVVVNGKKIELKPTKLKYFRNKAASAYGIINAVPLHELLTYDKGVLDPKRNADQLVFDFLIAAFDDVEFVKENYDEMDADTVDRVCKIFGRLNHIEEKQEAARKNKEAQAKR